MNTEVHDALRAVWHRHREAVLNDLTELIALVGQTHGHEEITTRAHRILGSLSMVGLDDESGILRRLETSQLRRDEEVVDRLHDLLSRLRNAP